MARARIFGDPKRSPFYMQERMWETPESGRTVVVMATMMAHVVSWIKLRTGSNPGSNPWKTEDFTSVKEFLLESQYSPRGWLWCDRGSNHLRIWEKWHIQSRQRKQKLRETSGASIYGSELGINTHTVSIVFKLQCSNSNSLVRNLKIWNYSHT